MVTHERSVGSVESHPLIARVSGTIDAVLRIILDDWREDDLAFMPNLTARLESGDWINFRNHYADKPTCAPVRRGMFTGHAYQWHKRDQDAATYYQYCAETRRENGEWWGPWEIQLDTPREAGDDPEWSSGGIANWLRQHGVQTALFGHYDTHGYGQNTTTVNRDYTAAGPVQGAPVAQERVPADWNHWRALSGGSLFYSAIRTYKDADNVTNHGQDGWCDEVVQTVYNHAITAGSISSDGQGGWLATITVPTHGDNDRPVEVGDFIVVEGASPTAYRTTAPQASPSPGVAGTPGVEAEVVAVDGNDITYAVASSAGVMTTLGTCYIKKNYWVWTDTYNFIEWVQTKALYERWFAVLSFNTPHQAASDNTERERIYIGTVNRDDFYMRSNPPDAFPRNPQPGEVSATVDPLLVTNTVKNQWQQRQELCRTMDDCIEAALAEIENLGLRVAIEIVSDQGVHYGEYDLFTNTAGEYFVKDTAFYGVRSALYMLIPGRAGATITTPTFCADIPLTELDLLGITDHHAHVKREGYSLLRLMDDDDYPNRAIWIRHFIKNTIGGIGDVDALIEADGYKWIAPATNGGGPFPDELMFDTANDREEITNLAPSESARATSMATRAALLATKRGEDRRTT